MDTDRWRRTRDQQQYKALAKNTRREQLQELKESMGKGSLAGAWLQVEGVPGKNTAEQGGTREHKYPELSPASSSPWLSLIRCQRAGEDTSRDQPPRGTG